MAMVETKRTKFEPIVIEIDGQKVEICSCGQTKNEDRTCDETHEILNAEMEKEDGLTVIQVLEKLNAEQQTKGEKHKCSCGGNCGCRGH